MINNVNNLDNISTNESSSLGLVNSVIKAMKVLNCFSPTQPHLTLAQISQQLNMPKSTVLNMIRTLEAGGYLIKGKDTQSYFLGYKILELSYSLRTTLPVVQYSLPFLEDLQIATGEIIYLTSHVNGNVLYLEGVYPSRRIAHYSVSGKTLPMHCTGCGKAMLAYLPKEETQKIIETSGLPRITHNTITEPSRLFEELEIIRERGYSIDIEEETIGVKCIGMAIRNSRGYATGSISISGTTMSMRDELLDGYAKLLAHTCSALRDSADKFPAGLLKI